jgi:hypothetical protein
LLLLVMGLLHMLLEEHLRRASIRRALRTASSSSI